MPFRTDTIDFDDLAADPGSLAEGQVWFNNTASRLRLYRSTAARNIVDTPVAFPPALNDVLTWNGSTWLPAAATTLPGILSLPGVQHTLFVDTTTSSYTPDGTPQHPYNSVAAALTAAAALSPSPSNPVTVYLYPGVYSEAPMTVPSYVSVVGEDTDRCIVAATNNSSPLFTMSTNSAVRNLTVNGPTSSQCVYSNGAYYVFVENVAFAAGQEAVYCTGAAGQIIVEECKTFPSVGCGIHATGSGRIDCSNVLQYATEAFHADGGTLWIHNSGCVGSTYGFHAENGGVIYPHNVTLEGCTTAIWIEDATDVISGNSVSARFTTTYDIQQDTAGGVVKLTGCRFDSQLFNIIDWTAISISYDATISGQEVTSIAMEFQVGVPELGHESALGEGDDYTRGMVVITSDGTATSTTEGGNLTDVSVAAQSVSGSTFTFQGVTANHTIMFGSDLDNGDKLKHWGLRVLQTTAAVEVTPKSFVFEIWDGAAWTAIGIMSTSYEEAYRYANEVFIRANSDEIVRFGIDENTTWAKKTISGHNLYWCRIRIVTTVTTAPVFQQFRLSTSHVALSVRGYVEMKGLARFKRTLLSAGNVFGEDGGVTDADFNVGSGSVPDAWLHNTKNSLLNGNGDAVMIQFPIPDGIDTSFPVQIRLTWKPTATGSTGVNTITSFLPVERINNLEADPTGGKTPVARTDANTETLTAKAASTDSYSFTSTNNDKIAMHDYGPFNIEDYYEGDFAFVRFELDDDGSPNCDLGVVGLELIGVNFALGNKI